jgi:hypothetical protein
MSYRTAEIDGSRKSLESLEENKFSSQAKESAEKTSYAEKFINSHIIM